jgi:hypothetical protein
MFSVDKMVRKMDPTENHEKIHQLAGVIGDRATGRHRRRQADGEQVATRPNFLKKFRTKIV